MVKLIPVYVLPSILSSVVWADGGGSGGKVVSILTMDDKHLMMNNSQDTQRGRRRLPHFISLDDLLYTFDDECPGAGRWEAFQAGSTSGKRSRRKLDDALTNRIVIDQQTLEFDVTIEWDEDCTGSIDSMTVDGNDFFEESTCPDSFFDIWVEVDDRRRRLEDASPRLTLLLVGRCETECTSCSSFAWLLADVSVGETETRRLEGEEAPSSVQTTFIASANDASSTERRLDDYSCVLRAYLDLDDDNFEYDASGRLDTISLERENVANELFFEEIDYEFELDDDDDGDDDEICLSSYSTVFVRDCSGDRTDNEECETTEIFMKDLQQGDEILVDITHQKYQKVFAFGHLDLFSVAKFIQIETAGQMKTGNTTTEAGALEISGEHLLFKAQGDGVGIPVRADSVQVGDDLAMARNKAEPTNRVANLNHVSRPGLYTPLVQDGAFIANGVKVSCYTAIPQSNKNGNDAQYVKLRNYPIVSHHVLNHMAATPLRVMCQIDGKGQSSSRLATLFCEPRNTEGQLLYVSAGDQIVRWCSQQNVVVQGLVLSMFALIMLPYFGMEQLIMNQLDPLKLSFLSMYFVLSVASIIVYLTRHHFTYNEKPRKS